MKLSIFAGNDHILRVSGVKNTNTNAYLNSATVTVTLQDRNGNSVVGETWPLSLTYVTGSDGEYTATLADTLTLTAGTPYEALITVNGGAGLLGYWVKTVEVNNRVV